MSATRDPIADMRAALDNIKRTADDAHLLQMHHDSYRKAFGEAARRARIARWGEKSLRSTAEAFGVSASFLSDFEKGRRWSALLAEQFITSFVRKT